MSFETFIITFSYVGIFALMVLNGICGFPSSQIIYLISGYFAYKGDINLFLVIIIGGIAHSIGNIILYEVSRRKGLDYISKFKIFPKKEIKKVNAVMKKKGWWFLFFGKLVNPIKIIIPIPAGISKLNRVIFSSIVLITSIIWSAIFVLLGYFFGKTFDYAIYYGVIMIVLSLVIVGIFYKYMNSKEILKLVE
jgi:membrane protein DedA with SNARE-associated domain